MAWTSSDAPERSVAHERLAVWVGQWHVEGQSYASRQSDTNPRGTVEPWVTDETVEWVPGRFFVMKRTDGTVGNHDVKSVDVCHFDPARGDYVTRTYENHGFIRDYVTRVDGNTWTFIGDTERARVEFADGGDTQRITWEWRRAGQAWLPLCDRVARRVGVAPAISTVADAQSASSG